jgi:predicted GNAT family acetyltransferase
VAVTINAAPKKHRYEIFVDDERAGFTQYRPAPGEITFVHTEISEQFGGQGLAGELIRYALADVREQGLAVLPECPFVRGFIAKHEEFLDLVPAGKRAQFDL